VSLLAAAAVVTALVGVPAGATAPPPGSIPPGTHVQVVDRQLGIVAVELRRAGSAAALARLRNAPGVRYVTVPSTTAGGLAAGCTFKTPSQVGAHPSTTWRKTISLTTHSAEGFTVGIPDTGADLGRLGGVHDRLIVANFTHGSSVDVSDAIDHGTEIASLIGADRVDLGVKGVAPDVGLAVARIATTNACDPGTLARNLIYAFAWFRKIGDVQIVNVSLTLKPNPALVQSLRALQQSGTLVVAATGNDPTPGKTTFPASEPHVIGVGALGSGKRKIYPDSGRGSFVDLVAPGAGSGVVISSEIPSDQQASVTPNGTSFAAPLVSGAAALVWARHPSWDASRVAAALMLSATHLSGARPNPTSGYGRLNVKAALRLKPPADLDEPNDWSAAARGWPALPHGPLLSASVGGSIDPLDAYPLTTTARATIRIAGKGRLQAYLLRSGAIEAIDGTTGAVRSSSTAQGAGTSIALKVPRAGTWFVVVTATGSRAPRAYTLHIG
jgi:subtilisin family serine protease